MNDEKIKKKTLIRQLIACVGMNVMVVFSIAYLINLYIYDINNPLPANAPHDIDYIIFLTVLTTTCVIGFLSYYVVEIIYLIIYLRQKRCEKCECLNRKKALYCDKCGDKLEKE